MATNNEIKKITLGQTETPGLLVTQPTAQQNQVAQTSATAAAPTTAATAQQTTNAQSNTSTLKGVSSNTQAQLNQYTNGYAPSANVQAAKQYLDGIINKKPVAQQQLSDLYDRIMNREKFTYDLNGDMLYQQYKDQYQNLGRQAMMDTMGNAATLTGGYGNSYASTAGNQAYQQYLQQLNDKVPSLYQMALQKYQTEGNELQDQYNMAYSQYRDDVGDWENERNYANTAYENERSQDYNQYQTMLNYWNQMAGQENTNYYTDRDYAWSQAKAIIDKKGMPSADLLAAAGLTEADAIAMGARKPSSGGGGGRKKKSGGTAATTEAADTNGGDYSYSEIYRAIRSGASSASIYKNISKSEKSGKITSKQANQLKNEVGRG